MEVSKPMEITKSNEKTPAWNRLEKEIGGNFPLVAEKVYQAIL